MSTASTTNHIRSGTAGRNATHIRGVILGAGLATLANAAIWLAGRAADASFVVSPPLADTTMTVGIALVVLATLLAFGVGWAALTLAARRSRRWARAVLVAAVLVAVVSALAPPTVADDTSTGLLLSGMHVMTGIAFVVTAVRVGPR